jgi:hypothetical protein
LHDDPVVELTTSQNGQQVPAASLDAITTLIHSFGSMMTSMEARLSTQIKENAAASKERWMRWETDFKEYRLANDERVNALRRDLDVHLDERQRDEIRWDSRVEPLRTSGMWLGRHWRDLILMILGVLAVLGFSSDTLHQLLS